MARNGKSPKANSRNPKDWKDFEFVNIPMSEADKAHFKEDYAANSAELLDQVVALVEGEYKLSVTWDKSNDCFIASLTCKHETDDNYGYVLSSRAGDMWQAIALGAFKHINLTKDGTWPKEKPENNFG